MQTKEVVFNKEKHRCAERKEFEPDKQNLDNAERK
jgi:hypothetical protein